MEDELVLVPWEDIKDDRGAGLTKRQKIFCESYVSSKTLNASEAMREAGYETKTIDKKVGTMLSNPKCIEYITRLQAARQKRLRIDADEVLRRLLRIANKAEEENDYNPALRALELLGKHLALFTDKSIVEMKNPFSSGEDAEAVERDVERLTKIAGPKLAVIAGGKKYEEAE